MPQQAVLSSSEPSHTVIIITVVIISYSFISPPASASQGEGHDSSSSSLTERITVSRDAHSAAADPHSYSKHTHSPGLNPLTLCSPGRKWDCGRHGDVRAGERPLCPHQRGRDESRLQSRNQLTQLGKFNQENRNRPVRLEPQRACFYVT